MRAELLNPSDYLKAAEFGQTFDKEPTFTIKSAAMETLVDTNGKEKLKGVIHFRETPKGLVTNVINVKCLIAMFGPETDAWAGKRVTLYEDPAVESFGEIVSGIRVRGSPDLPNDRTLKLKLKNKGNVTVHLKKIGTQTNARPAGQSKPPAADPSTEVIFSKHALHGRKIAELNLEQCRQLLEHAAGAKLEPGLKPEHLEQLGRQEAALKARLEALQPAEPGATG